MSNDTIYNMEDFYRQIANRIYESKLNDVYIDDLKIQEQNSFRRKSHFSLR